MTEGTRCTGMSTTAFFAGLVAGIGTGLLLAPQSGARTRRQLHSLAMVGGENGQNLTRQG